MVLSVSTYTKSGAKTTTSTKLDAKIFGIKDYSPTLLKQAYLSYLANGRQIAAKTLTRTHVRGGGRKPWRQKGTGRARHGSIRSPIWRGGGIAFGPTGEENFNIRLSKQSKRVAVKQALSLAASESKVKVIETFAPKDGKTKEAHALLMKLEADKRVLIVVENKTKDVIRATDNLRNVKVVQATYLNVYDVMNADTVILEKKALVLVKEWLDGGKNA